MLHATKYKIANKKADRDILCLLFLLVQQGVITHEVRHNTLFLLLEHFSLISQSDSSIILLQGGDFMPFK